MMERLLGDGRDGRGLRLIGRPQFGTSVSVLTIAVGLELGSRACCVTLDPFFFFLEAA